VSGFRIVAGVGWAALAAAGTPAGGAAQACPVGAPVAFVNVQVLAMDAERLSGPVTVVVRDRKVSALNPAAPPPDACRVTGTGKVLMPGLADLHVHTSEREMPLFLAAGVTLVREMNGTPGLIALRERIARGGAVGPTMLVASPLLVGRPLQYRHLLLESPDEAYQAAHQMKDAGFDFLKIYDGLSRPVYDALVEAGATLHLPLDGHIPADVGLAAALAAGQSLQHMDKIAFALAGHSGDTSAFAEARRLFRGRRAWVTPTLASLRALDNAGTVEYAAGFDRPEMAYVDSASLGWWRSLSGTRSRTGASPVYRFQAALLPVLRESGARFLLGTDAGNPLMVAGFSVHEELAILVRDGGLTPYEALTAATRNVGEFLGDSLRGRVVSGAPADLILVDANPLTDLARLRTPTGVMAKGRWFTRTELDAMLVAARRR
jgi:hypothetical protein